MIPLRDDTPRFTTPFITYFLLALNIAIFIFEKMLDERSLTIFLYQFGVVPTHVTQALGAGLVGSATDLYGQFPSPSLCRPRRDRQAKVRQVPRRLSPRAHRGRRLSRS